MSKLREVLLPADLCAAAEKKFGSQFHNVNELVIFLLRELISRETVNIDRADQAVVEERLRDLGYI